MFRADQPGRKSIMTDRYCARCGAVILDGCACQTWSEEPEEEEPEEEEPEEE
jgi:hypothetical protein